MRMYFYLFLAIALINNKYFIIMKFAFCVEKMELMHKVILISGA